MSRVRRYRSVCVAAVAIVAPVPAAAEESRSSNFLHHDSVGTTTLTLASGDEADVYYPNVEGGGPYPTIAFLQGALVDKQFYSEWGRQVAQFGFVVFIPNRVRELPPGAPPMLFSEPEVIVDVQKQAVEENADPESVLYSRIDTTKLGVGGHSFGGAAALFAVDETCAPPFCFGTFERPDELQAAALFGANTAVGEDIVDIDSSDVAVGLIQGGNDGVAEPADGRGTYDLLEAPRALISVGGLNHFGITDVDNPPGANPDANPSDVDQTVANRTTAILSAIFFRAILYGDPFAQFLIFESGGLPGGAIDIDSER